MVTITEAYDRMHAALLQLGPEVKDPQDVGQTALETFRQAASMLQLALILKMDGIDPASLAPKSPKAVTLVVPMRTATLDAIRRLAKEAGEDAPEMAAARILESWMRDNGLI